MSFACRFLVPPASKMTSKLAIPAIVHTVSRPMVDSKLENTCADAFVVSEVAHLNPIDSRLNPGAGFRILLLKPSSKVVGPVTANVPNDLHHLQNCSQIATDRQQVGPSTQIGNFHEKNAQTAGRRHLPVAQSRVGRPPSRGARLRQPEFRISETRTGQSSAGTVRSRRIEGILPLLRREPGVVPKLPLKTRDFL